MGAVEPGRFQLGDRPEFFFHRLTCRRQLCRRRTTNEQSLNDRAFLNLSRKRSLEVVSHLAEPVNDSRFFYIVRRHLQPDAVAHGQADKTFAHFSRDVCEHEVFVSESDAKHCSGQHGGNGALELDRFF